jgi:hypothetical protein
VFPAPEVKKTVTPAVQKTSAAPTPPPTEEPEPAEEPAPSITPELAAGVTTAGDGMIDLGHWLIVGALAVAALVAGGAGLSRLRRRGTR